MRYFNLNIIYYIVYYIYRSANYFEKIKKKMASISFIVVIALALTLKGSCVQTLVQTKKASHFEVDLETKQKERSPSCQKRNSCETANHFYVYKHQVVYICLYR